MIECRFVVIAKLPVFVLSDAQYITVACNQNKSMVPTTADLFYFASHAQSVQACWLMY